MVQEYPTWGQYMVTGYVEVGIWRRVGGVWSMVTTEIVNVQAVVGSAGAFDVPWGLENNYSLGSGVDAFGATIQGSDGPATLTYLQAQWTVTAASGERSATPAGQLSTVTVRPI